MWSSWSLKNDAVVHHGLHKLLDCVAAISYLVSYTIRKEAISETQWIYMALYGLTDMNT